MKQLFEVEKNLFYEFRFRLLLLLLLLLDYSWLPGSSACLQPTWTETPTRWRYKEMRMKGSKDSLKKWCLFIKGFEDKYLTAQTSHLSTAFPFVLHPASTILYFPAASYCYPLLFLHSSPLHRSARIAASEVKAEHGHKRGGWFFPFVIFPSFLFCVI